MKVSENKVVRISYELREDNASGIMIETVNKEQPMTFLFGAGNLLPEFEQNINGLSVGNTFEFGIKSENAYGEVDQNALVTIPKSAFMVNGQVDEQMLEVGGFLPMVDQDGNHLHGKIIAVNAENVNMDFNHPLAGSNLFFKGEIVDIREATEDELAHGHVHGEGGHHH